MNFLPKDNEWMWVYKIQWPCWFLDNNNNCSDYKNRPKVCRMLEEWKEDCQSMRRKATLK